MEEKTMILGDREYVVQNKVEEIMLNKWKKVLEKAEKNINFKVGEITNMKLVNAETGETIKTFGAPEVQIESIESECPPPSEEMIFMKSNNNVASVARCHKIEPFDVFEICDREAAFEEAKKLQDNEQNVSVVLASNGKVYIQFLTENDLFLHSPLWSN